MYPSSNFSSSHGSTARHSGGDGLSRYRSAPSSDWLDAIDSVINGGAFDHSVLPTSHPSPTGTSRDFSDSAGTGASSKSTEHGDNDKAAAASTIEVSYDSRDLTFPYGVCSGGASTSSLVRHSSSPARLLNQLAAAVGDNNGFQVPLSSGSCHSGVLESRQCMSRLNSQLSLKRQETLSQVVLGNGNDVGGSNNMENVGSFTVGSWSNNKEHSETISTMGSWRENDIQPVMCSVTPFSSAKNINCDISRSLGEMENQLQFRMPHEALLEMETMDSYLHIPEVSVPCKVRAKRGCATHPRSIAERERRTRISGKLKKLQDLVPNMDKQTSYADMLDFAVQHIKSLQEKLQELNKDREQCTCGVVDA